MKMMGSEFKAWYEGDFWGTGYWDNYSISINGETVDDFNGDSIKDTDKIEIWGGVVYSSQDDRDGVSFTSHYNRWKKKQTTTFLAIQVNKDDLEELRLLLEGFGKGRTGFKVTGGK